MRDPQQEPPHSPTFSRPDFVGLPSPPSTVGPARFTKDCALVYERSIHALRDAGVPILLGGALAINRYTGLWRDTKDLDLFIEHRHLSRALEVLRTEGLETGEVHRSWLAKAWQGDVFVDLIHRGLNGVHVVTPEWFDRGVKGRFFDREVPFISPEDLLVQKIFVGSRVRFDGADVLHLLHVKGPDLDWDLVLQMVGRDHAGLLLAHLQLYRWAYPGFADRVPDDVKNELDERAASDVEAPSVPFRGTLLDAASFSVDVHGWGLPDPHQDLLKNLREEWDVPTGVPFW